MRFCGAKEGGATQRNYRINRPTHKHVLPAEYSAERGMNPPKERTDERICKVDFAFDENDDDDGEDDDDDVGESVMDGRSGQQTVLLCRSVCAQTWERRNREEGWAWRI